MTRRHYISGNFINSAATAIAAVAILLGCAACSHKDKTEETEEMTVSVAPVMEDSIMIRKSYPGILAAVSKADVVARVNGTIKSQLFKPGDYVRAGQALFTIESTIYSDAVKSATAQLSNARSAYDYASRRYTALKRAYESDATAEIDVIQAKSTMDQAAAQIRSAAASLQDARTKLGYCTVRAPFAGYITDATLKPGSYVGGEMSPVTLATVYDNTSMEVTFSIPDGAYIEMFTGDSRPAMDYSSIPITFSQSLSHDYSGAISYMAPNVNNTTGTLELKAKVQNPYNELKDGMYATIALPFRNEPHAMLVKDAAVQTDQRGQYVYVVNSNDMVVYTPLSVGELYHDSLRVVEEGLKPGDRYITKALLKVKPGMKVKPTIAR
ncbi:MAG: efflux RND transporter periplasmic adaptor subunit [Lepagella sp.]